MTQSHFVRGLVFIDLGRDAMCRFRDLVSNVNTKLIGTALFELAVVFLVREWPRWMRFSQLNTVNVAQGDHEYPTTNIRDPQPLFHFLFWAQRIGVVFKADRPS